jgi:hypothetical protein
MSKTTIINCPNCNEEINVNSVLANELEIELKNKYHDELKKVKMEFLSKEDSLNQKLEDIAKKEKLIKDEIEKATNHQVQKLMKEYQAKARKEAEFETLVQVQMLQKELDEKSAKVIELNQTKAEIQKLQREKSELESSIKARFEAQMNEQLRVEKEKMQKALDNDSELKLKQKDEQMEQLRKQLQEAQRKAEQGSMQLQGETQELAIEEWLESSYPFDSIEEIKKGQRGADCLQTVHTRESQNCGTIYYESKRTKEFKRDWIPKFKSDMIEKGADIGVLVTSVLPKELNRMGLVDGVWVCTYEEFKGLSSVLRENIIKISQTLQSNENKTDKMSILYSYLTSNEFKMQIEAIVEGFTQMQIDLDSEKRAMARIWKQREKQINKVIDNTTGMYGSIQGIAGNAVGNIQALELGV